MTAGYSEKQGAFPHFTRNGSRMAYFRKLKTGWRAEVQRKGVRASQVFQTKAEATAWAAKEEAGILAGARAEWPLKTVSDAFRRYEIEVSRTKRGGHAEALRFGAVMRDFPELADKLLHAVTPADIAAWRDERLRHVCASSVVREAAQLRNVWTVASREWGWCGDSPWAKVKLPRKAHARTRRTHWTEVRRLVRHMGYVTGEAPTTPMQEVAWCYLLAQHTAMRAGEVRTLRRSTVDLKRRVVTLHTHKTVEREGVRFVPVTRKAARLLAVLDAQAHALKRDGYFTLSDQSLDVLFRKARDRLLLKDLHFHDSRADCLTRLSKRVDVLTLAKISGHRDLNQLLDAYYRTTAAEIAEKL